MLIVKVLGTFSPPKNFYLAKLGWTSVLLFGLKGKQRNPSEKKVFYSLVKETTFVDEITTPIYFVL